VTSTEWARRRRLLANDPARLVSTYSIVARDSASGELGIAVQSHYFSVGGTVPWAEPGVGAVATQAFAERSYGPLGLAKLAEGMEPEQALALLLSEDPGRASRQVAIVDAQGRSATHTGSGCVQAAGHRAGEGYSAQGNMLRSEAVWQAMGEAFEAARGSLELRLFAALEAGEAAGGDLRGKQSAAMLIVSGERSDTPWAERRLELRIEDHHEPLLELARLMEVDSARCAFEEATAAFGAGDLELALERIATARELNPGNPEFTFWAGVAFATSGREDEAIALLHEAFEDGEGWRDLLRRLPAVGMLPDDDSLVARLCAKA
jgi:uncharacterized Ntn-hydrolase superfamily protein